jgi:hypothetical protein
MLTRNDIKKLTGFQTMMATNQTGQLSENCAIFDDILPGVQLVFSIIKKKPIRNNANFDVQEWFNTRNHIVKMNLSSLFIDIIYPSDSILKQKEMCSDTVLARVITSDAITDGDTDNISYLFQIVYSENTDLLSIRKLIDSVRK